MTQTQKLRVIEQAAMMFAQQGIKSVRMDDIATELSVSKRTLYSLFGDKEELIYCSLQQLLNKQREEHAQIMLSSENELEALFLIMKSMRRNAVVGRRMENNLKKFYPMVHERLHNEGAIRNNTSLKRILERGIEKGIFRSEINCDLVISMFSAIGKAMRVNGESIIPEQIHEEEAVMEIITTLFRGIATAKGLEIIDHHMNQFKHEINKTVEQ